MKITIYLNHFFYLKADNSISFYFRLFFNIDEFLDILELRLSLTGIYIEDSLGGYL